MIKQIIVVRKDLNMRKGKLAAQVAHASMKVLLDSMSKGSRSWCLKGMNKDTPLNLWLKGLFTKIVVSVDSELELLKLITKAAELGIVNTPIIDAGNTEFNRPTLTCVAFGPDESNKIDQLTGHLKLL